MIILQKLKENYVEQPSLQYFNLDCQVLAFAAKYQTQK